MKSGFPGYSFRQVLPPSTNQLAFLLAKEPVLVVSAFPKKQEFCTADRCLNIIAARRIVMCCLGVLQRSTTFLFSGLV
ncbi:hypothetical protein L596_001159 [Steinernema carpocapsae]|uniref:Uncharacterized protein n=1 Tax=Steinernema carpocapsae TaxID=34508 RepID=A0A4U8UMI8_STECR|nr:hypothetical protein L596_001159 [Steinernema carpocapsae]